MTLGEEIDPRDECLLGEIRKLLDVQEPTELARRQRLLAELLAPYRPVVRGLVASRLWRLGQDAVEEWTQQVWLRLLDEVLSGKTWQAPFRAIVIAAAGFVSGDAWEEVMKRRERTTLVADPPPATGDPAVEDEAIGSIMVEGFTQTLSERDSEIARLCWGEGYPSKIVGERLGMTDNAVNQRKHQIKRRLREYLDL